MPDFLQMILAFVVAISIIIAVHEFGHFWVAKKLGVKVLRYSIGFGKPLFKFVAGADKTEYVIASIPLGGYVKMLDEREGEVDRSEKDRAFNNQHVWKRFAIVFAGPAFNFVLAFFAFWLMLVNGISGIKPVVDTVADNTPAASAGMRSGDQIIQVNGKDTPVWSVIIEELLPSVIDKKQSTLTVVDKANFKRSLQLDYSNSEIDTENLDILKATGFTPYYIKLDAVVGKVSVASPAEKAGIVADDKILSINNEHIATWNDLGRIITKNENREISVILLRNNRQITLQLTPRTLIHKDKKYVGIGIAPKPGKKVPEEMKATYQYPLLKAATESIDSTIRSTRLTFLFIGKLITGEISISNLSSPIGIAQYLGVAAKNGLGYFLMMIAQISISIGILNLLPIPLLDGGHLFYYLIEIIRGKPVPENVEIIGQKFGIAMLLMLMSVAVYNDLLRLLN